MVVITVSKCPARLRGDLTRWMFEIDTGVYVGNMSARVREAVWARVCDNIENGTAAMVWSSHGEQKLDFKLHNAIWEPVDCDGIKLVKRSFPDAAPAKRPVSNAEIRQMNSATQRARMQQKRRQYVTLDVETTGLTDNADIIEVGALRIGDGIITDSYSALIKTSGSIPASITQLTGITSDMIDAEGISLKEAIEGLLHFCGDDDLIGYNISFDMQFINAACEACDLKPMLNTTVDVMRIARKQLRMLTKYRMSNVADALGLQYDTLHRAIDDCKLAYLIYEKLNENNEESK